MLRSVRDPHPERHADIERDALASENGVFVARATWNAGRQLIYYVHDPELANRLLQRRLNVSPARREWEFILEKDVEWREAQPYLELARLVPS